MTGQRFRQTYSSIKFQSRSYRVSIFIEIDGENLDLGEKERAVYPRIKRIKGLAVLRS